MALTGNEITLTDTINDSDSVSESSSPVYALVVGPAETYTAPALREREPLGTSFIICGLFLLFLFIALRFRNNLKYLGSMFRNLIEIRMRQNVFDDTVRETSLLILLNILWCACAGIIGFCWLRYVYPDMDHLTHPSVGMLWGMVITGAYTLFMFLSYGVVGRVFSDRGHTDLWLKGYSASMALMAPAFFLIALIGICQPSAGLSAGVTGLIVFFVGKLLFIWKGYRIFFNQFSSWVLFLCYLCSLEIVPLILSYRCALLLGRVL